MKIWLHYEMMERGLKYLREVLWNFRVDDAAKVKETQAFGTEW